MYWTHRVHELDIRGMSSTNTAHILDIYIVLTSVYLGSLDYPVFLLCARLK